MICTDGESSDGDLATAMKPLEQLPVSVIVRLCTNDDKVVSYWNNIDASLELDMEVIDDIFSEVLRAHPSLVLYAYPSLELRALLSLEPRAHPSMVLRAYPS